MSIFDFSPFRDELMTEDKLKKIILDFFNSNFHVVDFYTNRGFNFDDSCYWITIEKLIGYFLIDKKIPLSFEHLDLVTIHILIELFLNLWNNYSAIIEDYINDSNECGSNCIYTNPRINEFNNNLYSYIISFLEYKNIKIKKTRNNIYTLCFDSPILLEKSSSEVRDTINKYLKIKNITTENSLIEKQNIMSGLKNYLGRFFGREDFIQKGSFLNMDISKIKMYWQSLFSHKDDNQNNRKEHIEIKENWNKRMPLSEKHKMIDEIFDCAVYINYKINTK